MRTGGDRRTGGALGLSRKVTVGVDDTPASRAALRWAAEWGLHTDARVQAVAVWAPPSPMVAAPEIGGAAVGAGLLTDEQFQAQARSWLDDAVAALPAGAERIVDREVVHGDAANVLLDAARDSALLVVGNAGRGALTGLLVGSVALRCAHHARCPVVLVPSPDDPSPDDL